MVGVSMCQVHVHVHVHVIMLVYMNSMAKTKLGSVKSGTVGTNVTQIG